MIVFHLAWRYARARLINLVAVIAVALCLTVQIVVMAILDGNLRDLERRYAQMGDHITASFSDDLPTLAELKKVETEVKRTDPGVLAITPRVEGFGTVSRAHFRTPIMIRGFDLAREAKLSGLPGFMTGPKLDPNQPEWFTRDQAKSGLPPIFLGARVAENIGVAIGDTITLNGVNRYMGENGIQQQDFIVTNIFRTGNGWTDVYFVYIPLVEAQTLFLDPKLKNRKECAELFSVWLKEPTTAAKKFRAITGTMSAILGDREQRYGNWQERWQSALQAMAHENMLQEIVMVLMNLSGGFCVFAILATLVSRRIKDIGLLRCIGAGRVQVVLVFLLVGLMVGVAGSLLGVGGGFYLTQEIDPDGMGARIAVWWFELSGQKMYPPRQFGIEKLPVYINYLKVFSYACGATLISILAAAYPAFYAGTRQPVEALRDD